MSKRKKEIEIKIESLVEQIETRDDLTVEEIEKIEKELKDLEDEKGRADEIEERRSALLQRVSNGAGRVVSTFIPQGNVENNDDVYSTAEYRSAFKKYVTTGQPIGAEFRADATTITTDVGAVIPTTISSQIIEKLEQMGELYQHVTRTNIRAGFSVAVETLKPTAVWVAENKKSDKQKKTLASITFGGYKLRCAVAQSLEVSVMSIDAFENLIIKNIVQAMSRAIEASIVNGAGSASPTGILKESFDAKQTVTVTAWNLEVIEKVEKSIPIEYEDTAVWVLPKTTFVELKFIKDANGRPIAMEDLNVKGAGRRTLFNRPVLLTSEIVSLEASSVGDKLGFVGDLSDYIFNTNYEMTFGEYVDNETEEKVKKAVMLADGKLARKDSFVMLVKGE